MSIEPDGPCHNNYTAEVFVYRTLNGATYSPAEALTVTLTCSDPGKASVPATVTIPADAYWASFQITGVDLTGGTPITVDATATNYTSPATKLPVSVITPVLEIMSLDTARSNLSLRDDFYVRTRVPGAYYDTNQGAATALSVDLSATNASTAGIVQFYDAASAGNVITQTTILAGYPNKRGTNNNQYQYVGQPTTTGSYTVTAAIPATGSSVTSGTVTVSPADLRLGFRIGYIGDPAFDAFANDDVLAQMIQSQDKLSEIFGRKRTTVSIGIYELDRIEFQGSLFEQERFAPIINTLTFTPFEVLSASDRLVYDIASGEMKTNGFRLNYASKAIYLGKCELSARWDLVWEHNFLDPFLDVFSLVFGVDAKPNPLWTLSFSVISRNEDFWKYFRETNPDPVNPLNDLLKSFNLFDKNDREESSFKLKGVMVGFSRDLHDWLLMASFRGDVELSYDRKSYEWNNTFSVGLSLNKVRNAQMKKQGGGTILNMSSVAGVQAWSGTGTYSASKHAIMALSKALADEGRAHRIKVSAICPGGVADDLVDASAGERAGSEKIDPFDIAETALYLACLGPQAAVHQILVDRMGADW